MDTNNITLYNVVKNGSFESAEYWYPSTKDVDGVSTPVVSREYLNDIGAYASKIDTKKCYTGEYDWPVGMYQTFYLPRATDSSELTVSFDTKLISGSSLYSYMEVWFFKGYVNGDYLSNSNYGGHYRFSITKSDWKTHSITLKTRGPGRYYLFFTGYFDRGSGTSSLSQFAGEYKAQTFLVKNVQSELTNCIKLISNRIENGDFSNSTNGWSIVDGVDSSTFASKKTVLSEDDKNYLNVKSHNGYATTLSQGVDLPVIQTEDESKYHADFHFSYRLDYKSKLRVRVYDNCDRWNPVILEKTIEGDKNGKGEWKRLSFSSQELDIPIPYNETSYSESLYVEFYIEGKYTSDSIDVRGYDVDIADVRFDIFNIEDVIPTGNEGTIDNPYTDEDGRRLYRDSSVKFKFYSGEIITKNSIYCEEKELADGSYEHTLYLIDSNGYFCKEGFHNCGDMTYFTFSDGRIAFNEQFIYEWKVYRADESGECVFIRNKLYYIDVVYKSYKVNSRRIETVVGTARLELFFPEQNSEVSMTVKGANGDSVIKRAEIMPGKKSNIVDITTEYGLDELIVSYIDEDGDEVVSRVTVNVVSGEYEYAGEVNIDIISDVHYVAIDSSFTIPYIIRPQLAVTVDIDWISSDESVALVDVFGNIKPMGIGTCTITAVNYESGASDTCELRIVESIVSPTSIEVSKSYVEIGIADSIFIETTVRATLYSVEFPTSQEVKWTSENPSIAKVDNGYIIGTGQGTTNVYCYSYEKPSLMATIVVNVSGEVTAIKDIELNMYETMLNADEPLKYEYIGWTFVPRNTNQIEVIWTSSNTDIVKVAANGRLSIGDAPMLNTPVLIKCTSVSNPEIYRECEVTVVQGGAYTPTITMKEKSVRTYVGKTVDVSYGITPGYDIQQVSIKNASDGSSTSNTATINSADKKIRLNIKQAGSYILTASYVSNNVILVNKTCKLTIYEAHLEPQFIRNLGVQHSFFDGSYILAYFAVDSDDDLNLTHYINIDNEDYFSSVNPQLMLYEGNEYFYIFGDGLDPGSHTVKIKVVDSNAYESISETRTIIIPSNDNNKECLSEAKGAYDEIKNDLIDVLERIIKDDKMSVDDKREFTTRYKKFNIGYENLLKILDTCVKYINSQIETSQLEIATIAEDLNANSGVAIAAYSEGDYTNSNFDNITDMDYYQNECIKALTQRILELEARLDALSNNNNN